jgi:hypothetical protein
VGAAAARKPLELSCILPSIPCGEITRSDIRSSNKTVGYGADTAVMSKT